MKDLGGEPVEWCAHFCQACQTHDGKGYWSHVRVVGRQCIVGYRAACIDHRRIDAKDRA